jgi:HEAT repeat protein
MGPAAKEALPALLKLAKDKSRENKLRSLALWALACVGGATNPDILPTLIAALEDSKQSALHVGAAEGVGELGPAGKAGVTALISLLDVQKAGRYEYPGDALAEFAWALAKIGPDAKEALPQLVKIVQDKKAPEFARPYAIKALGGIGPAAKGAIPAVMQVFLEPGADASILVESQEALVKIGPASVPSLIGALGTGSNFPRMMAAEALGKLGCTDPAVIQALETAQLDEDSSVRAAATQALNLLKQKQAKPKAN